MAEFSFITQVTYRRRTGHVLAHRIDRETHAGDAMNEPSSLPAQDPDAGPHPRRALLEEHHLLAIADQVVWARTVSGKSPWDKGGVVAALRAALGKWPTITALLAAAYTAADMDELWSPKLIATPGAFKIGPSPGSVTAAQDAARTYDMPCPDHPEHRGRCQVCAEIPPAPRPENFQDLVEEGRRDAKRRAREEAAAVA